MTTPPNLTTAELAEYFPRDRPLIKDGAFELGLVLAGTVSAGSYTAGVLDYLLEALDAWQRAKEDGDPDAPPHEVIISTISGASGGGINGALVLRSSSWQYPHGPVAGNPFYSSWTSGVSLEKLLTPGPNPSVPGFTSALNCASIEAQAKTSIAFTGNPLGSNGSPRHRAYLADPLRLFMTIGNLNGLPYRIQLAGETGLSHQLCSHGDNVRFALTVDQGAANKPVTRPDELPLSPASGINWNVLGEAALATCAFPIAFLSRQISRAMAVAGYRVTAIPAVTGPAEIAQLIPAWDLLAAGETNQNVSTFLNVDGGTFNNEPLDLVRTSLAGYDARNDRTPESADRAVILVDPFSDSEPLGRPAQENIVNVAGAIITSLISQARLKPEDIALASSENVYSRFLIAPVGPGPDNTRTVGAKAIASGALGGFSGFVDPVFLDYDFRLGRYNAFTFLEQHLAIPVTGNPRQAPNNPLFKNWTTDQVNNYAFANPQDPSDTKQYLPLIPLMRSLREAPPQLPPWPRLGALPGYLNDAVAARLASVYDMAKSAIAPKSWFSKFAMNTYLNLGWVAMRGTIRDLIVGAIRDGLVAQGLLPKPPAKP